MKIMFSDLMQLRIKKMTKILLWIFYNVSMETNQKIT